MTDPRTDPDDSVELNSPVEPDSPVEPESPVEPNEPLVAPRSRAPIWSLDGVVWFPTGLKGWALVVGGAILIGLFIAWL